jgi:hypothetical protein
VIAVQEKSVLRLASAVVSKYASLRPRKGPGHEVAW